MAIDPSKPKSFGEALVGNTFLRPLFDTIFPEGGEATRSVKLGVGPAALAPVRQAGRGRSEGMEA
jgi:hypothetical protein